MKVCFGFSSAFCFVAMLLSGCGFYLGDHYEVHTVVKADGSVERTVSFTSTDTLSRKATEFGASDSTGWQLSATILSDTARIPSYAIDLRKHYNSAAEATAEAAARTKGYRISSEFKSEYRWFYTRISFSDTYAAMIRFEGVSADDFLDDKEIAWCYASFLGDTTVTKDTVRSKLMDERMDAYMMYGVASHLANKLGRLMSEQGIDPRWSDSVKAHTRRLGEVMKAVEANELTLRSYLLDTLHLPLSEQALAPLLGPDDTFDDLPIFDDINHTIEMPSAVTSSNALAVHDRIAAWNITPYAAVKDFSLHAEARVLNYPEIIGTILAAIVLILLVRQWRSVRKA